jgi:mono/diheme cytochrome c family protein
MTEQPAEGNTVYWPRIKEILDHLMERWEERRGRKPLPGIHRYYWESSEQLANDVLSGIRAIEPGVPGRQTAFVRSLERTIGTWGKMPLRGPFLSEEELDEIVSWIDSGMPDGPSGQAGQTTADNASRSPD